jgi:hypothetical protein
LRIGPRNDVIAGRVSTSHYEIKRVQRNEADPSRDEAHALASIDDPHVSTAMEIEAERESRPSLIVIERPRGETLEHRGTMLPSRAVHVAIQIAHALHAAHVAGVIHRNVRPKNVMLVQTAVDDAFVKLTGFGGKAGKKKERDRFVPPEGNSKKVSGVHTDVFGVGGCLDAMLGPSRRRDPALTRIIARATAEDPKARYASAAELESALRAWSTGPTKGERNGAWYALGGLVAIGVGMIATNQHADSKPLMPSPVVREAHAAIGPSAAMQAASPAANEDVLEIGPPPLDSISAPPIAPPVAEPAAAGGAPANAAPAAAKVASTYVAPSGSFYVDEPLRYVSAKDGEGWRVSTTKRVSECVERIGTGDCELNAMELHCTLDRHGVMHCARLTPRDKAGKTCEVPPALDDCIGRAAAGVFTPKFDRTDVQLAEMKYWIRRAR